jgi:LuxR family maltose regulon positive regulatory protein
LEALYEQALARPVVAVVAGPGYGKTVSVNSYLRESAVRTVWVQLTDLDNKPVHFWETLTGAIARLNPNLATRLADMGFPNSEERRRFFSSAASDEIKIRDRYVLVFDDFQVLRPGKVLDFVTWLIRRVCTAPPSPSGKYNAAIVISPHDALPNTEELLASDNLSRIDETDLGFSKNEIYDYLKLFDISVANTVLDRIHTDTEGLPFAVSTAARILERNPTDSDYIHTALQGNFYRIIDLQLFSAISDDLRRFLLKISLVKHLSPELISQIEGGQEAMNALAGFSSLIRFDNYMHVYRLHHQLLQYLQDKQHLLAQEERLEVYDKAAQWCEANGYRIDALNYYSLMGNYDALVHVAADYPSMMPKDISCEILAALEKAPRELVCQNPELRVLYPRLFIMIGQVEQGLEMIHAEIAELEKRPSDAAANRALMGFYHTLGYAGMLNSSETHDYGFYRHFEKAQTYAPRSLPVPPDHKIVHSIGPYALRVGRAQAGDPEAYIESVRRSAASANTTLRSCMQGLEDLTRAEYAYFRGNATETETHALKAVVESQPADQIEIRARALYLLIRVYLQMGKYERLMEAMAQLDQLTVGQDSFNLHMLNEIAISWFYASIGEPNRVESWLQSDLWPSGINEHISGLEDFIKIKYFLAIKAYPTLLDFAQQRSQRFGIARFITGKVGLTITQAICYQHLGDKNEALACLGRAYELAQPNELFMPLIEMGNHMRSLASLALRVPESTLPRQWLETMRSRATTYAKRVAYVRSHHLLATQSGPSITLTSKELEILEDLAHGLSRTEMSLARGVSVNTVKSMLQMIYDKLGAEGALDAVRIATHKNLI